MDVAERRAQPGRADGARLNPGQPPGLGWRVLLADSKLMLRDVSTVAIKSHSPDFRQPNVCPQHHDPETSACFDLAQRSRTTRRLRPPPRPTIHTQRRRPPRVSVATEVACRRSLKCVVRPRDHCLRSLKNSVSRVGEFVTTNSSPISAPFVLIGVQLFDELNMG